jgi:fructoselysine-6-P-deglycase FrlB-like protein
MFELTANEKSELVTICDRLSPLKHSSASPMAFTEQGVSMLSSVLQSAEAIRINIEIMRAFARYRALLKENEALKDEIRKLDAKLNRAFRFLLDRIDGNAPKIKQAANSNRILKLNVLLDLLNQIHQGRK